MTFLWVVFSSVPRKFPSAGTLGPVQVYFWLGVFSLYFCFMFFNNGSSMDKSTETLGFGHCLRLSSSGLLATPRLTGKGNTRPSGTSVRFPSLSPSILAIDAMTSTALARTCILSANLPLPATFPPSSHLSSLLPGLPKAGLLARPRGRLVTRSKSSLGCYKEIPRSTREQWKFAGAEKRLAANYFCATKSWIQGQVFPKPIQVYLHVCAWAEGLHPLGFLPSPFLRGLLFFANCAGGGSLSSPTSSRTRPGDFSSLPLDGWGEAFPP